MHQFRLFEPAISSSLVVPRVGEKRSPVPSLFPTSLLLGRKDVNPYVNDSLEV